MKNGSRRGEKQHQQDAPSCIPAPVISPSHFTSTSSPAQNGFVSGVFTDNLVGERRSAEDRGLWTRDISYSIRLVSFSWRRGHRLRLILQSQSHTFTFYLVNHRAPVLASCALAVASAISACQAAYRCFNARNYYCDWTTARFSRQLPTVIETAVTVDACNQTSSASQAQPKSYSCKPSGFNLAQGSQNRHYGKIHLNSLFHRQNSSSLCSCAPPHQNKQSTCRLFSKQARRNGSGRP